MTRTLHPEIEILESLQIWNKSSFREYRPVTLHAKTLPLMYSLMTLKNLSTHRTYPYTIFDDANKKNSQRQVGQPNPKKADAGTTRSEHFKAVSPPKRRNTEGTGLIHVVDARPCYIRDPLGKAPGSESCYSSLDFGLVSLTHDL
jgi:hypothetical protein